MRYLPVLVAILCLSCVAYTTGAKTVQIPTTSHIPKPNIYLDFESSTTGNWGQDVLGDSVPWDFQANLKTEMNAALGRIGLQENSAPNANLVVTVEFDDRRDMSGWSFLSLGTLYLLPLPAVHRLLQINATLTAPPLEPFGLPTVHRKRTSWSGLAFIVLLPFFSTDHEGLRKDLSLEFALRVQEGYTNYLESSWATATTGGLESLANFVDAFPASQYHKKAIVRLEDGLWKAIEQNGAPADYFTYLKRFPDNSRASKLRATAWSSVWEEIKDSTSPDPFRGFIASFPTRAEHAREKLDSTLWSRAIGSQLAQRYVDYANELPGGARIREALDSIAWASAESAGSPETVQQYLNDWPVGLHAKRALKTLDILLLPDAVRWLSSLEILVNKTGIDPQNGSFEFRVSAVVSGPWSNVTTISNHTRPSTGGGVATLNGHKYRYANGSWNPVFPRYFDQNQSD